MCCHIQRFVGMHFYEMCKIVARAFLNVHQVQVARWFFIRTLHGRTTEDKRGTHPILFQGRLCDTQTIDPAHIRSSN